MSFGIAVYDASGNPLVDVADSVMTILGSFSRTFDGTNGSSQVTGSFSNSEFARGTPFYIVVQYPLWEGTGDDTQFAWVQISFSGNNCNWSVDGNLGGTTGTLVFYYGYF